MSEPKSLDEAFNLICTEALETFIKKHKDYGKENVLEMEELGIAIRGSEKLSRLKNLLLHQLKPENESLDETWIDIAVYSVIALMMRRGWFQKLELQESSSDNIQNSPSQQNNR
jgi:hypothetical protein